MQNARREGGWPRTGGLLVANAPAALGDQERRDKHSKPGHPPTCPVSALISHDLRNLGVCPKCRAPFAKPLVPGPLLDFVRRC
jgi:hypothetical protein